MTTQTIAKSPGQFLILLLTCTALSGLILYGEFEAAPRVWALLAILTLGLLVFWHLTRTGRFQVQTVDQFAWALLICHTVIIHVQRDIRILADDPTPSTEIAIQIAVWSACMAYAVARLVSAPHHLRILMGPGGRYAGLFCAAALFSATYAIGPMITLAWCMKLATILLLCCVLFDPRDPSGSCQRFVRATHLGLSLMVLQFVAVGVISPQSVFNTSDFAKVWRAGGALFPPTQLSAVAGLCCLLSAVDLLVGKRTRLAIATFGVAGGVMLAALGRGGILSASIGMLIVLAALRKLHLAAGVAMVMGLVLLAWPSLLDLSWRIMTRSQRDAELWSLTGRLPVWESSMDLISEKPILGWGYVSGARIGLLRSFNGWIAGGAHNAYIEILLVLGLVGAGIMAMLLWKTYAGTLKYLHHQSDPSIPSTETVAAVKVLAIIVCLTVEGLFESGFSGPPRFETTIFIGSVFAADQLRRLCSATRQVRP